MKARALLLALLLPAWIATAQEAKVRAHMELPVTPWVGQKVVMVVELLAPGYFSGSPDFDLPAVPGLLIFPPEDRPVLGSETIDGVAYTVQRHEILVFPRKAGNFTVPTFQVRFNIKRSPLEKNSEPQNVTTEPQHFTAALPPGADEVGTLISAREVKADEQWKPKPAAAKTGDAFTRTITWSAPDVPGMAFPPFPADKIGGLGVYPKSPQVSDHSERGTLQGSRTDTVVYVCEHPGHYVIPAAQFTWWDTEDKQLHTIDFPERAFDVKLNPAFAPVVHRESFAEKISRRTPALLTAIAALALIAYVGWRTRQFWRDTLDFLQPRHLVPLNPPDPSIQNQTKSIP